jgi:kinesin family protein 13
MSIKVAVRVRPFNQREKDRNSQLIVEMNDKTTILRDLDMKSEKIFTFDYSFWSHDSFEIDKDGYCISKSDKYCDQQYVYLKLGVDILDNAWSGYNCCLFAYGQTGSGKSYSMIGYGENKGIVPKVCNEIFYRIKNSPSENITHEVQVSMLEIYNEKIQDLLIDLQLRPTSGLKIRENKLVGTYVENLTKYPVQSYDEILKKMNEGNENRTIGSTLMNATSSRAHTIIIIEFKQISIDSSGKKIAKTSVINLVDLAGSERSNSTGATGDRLKEGCNINKSLFVLGNVINILADKSIGKSKALPPYRDSALTRILQNALGGNSKTIMICAISPADINFEESLSTLRYADRAKKIQNKAVINESENDKSIRLLREENIELKKQIDLLLSKLSIGGNIAFNEEEKTKIIEMKEEYEANVTFMNQMEKTFEERIEESRKKSKVINNNFNSEKPHLIVLNEDSQLSHKLKYSLENLPLYIGRKTGNPKPNIILSGVGVKINHAIIFGSNNEICIKPNDLQAKDFIFINGKRINNENNIYKLKHLDKLTFGSNTHMIFVEKSCKNENEIDYENVQTEYDIEREKEELIIELEKERIKEDEIYMIKNKLEEEFLNEKKKIEETLKNKIEKYEKELQEIKDKEEEKKVLLRKNKINIFNDENFTSIIEDEKSEKRKINESKVFREEKNNNEIIILNLVKKMLKLREYIKIMRRNFHIDIYFVCYKHHIFDDNEKIIFKIENFEEGEVYYWNKDEFINNFIQIEEHYELNEREYKNGCIKISSFKEFGFINNQKYNIFGYSFLSISPILYLSDFSISANIYSFLDIKEIGKIDFHIKIMDTQTNKQLPILYEPKFCDLYLRNIKIVIIIKQIILSKEYLNCKIEITDPEDNEKYIIFSNDIKSINEDNNIKYIFDEIYEKNICIKTIDEMEFYKEYCLIFSIYSSHIKTKKLGMIEFNK